MLRSLISRKSGKIPVPKCSEELGPACAGTSGRWPPNSEPTGAALKVAAEIGSSASASRRRAPHVAEDGRGLPGDARGATLSLPRRASRRRAVAQGPFRARAADVRAQHGGAPRRGHRQPFADAARCSPACAGLAASSNAAAKARSAHWPRCERRKFRNFAAAAVDRRGETDGRPRSRRRGRAPAMDLRPRRCRARSALRRRATYFRGAWTQARIPPAACGR